MPRSRRPSRRRSRSKRGTRTRIRSKGSRRTYRANAEAANSSGSGEEDSESIHEVVWAQWKMHTRDRKIQRGDKTKIVKQIGEHLGDRFPTYEKSFKSILSMLDKLIADMWSRDKRVLPLIHEGKSNDQIIQDVQEAEKRGVRKGNQEKQMPKITEEYLVDRRNKYKEIMAPGSQVIEEFTNEYMKELLLFNLEELGTEWHVPYAEEELNE